MKLYIFLLIIFDIFSKLSKSELKYKQKYKQLSREIKKERKLVLPMVIQALIEKQGIRTTYHHKFRDLWGGINNIKMA